MSYKDHISKGDLSWKFYKSVADLVGIRRYINYSILNLPLRLIIFISYIFVNVNSKYRNN